MEKQTVAVFEDNFKVSSVNFGHVVFVAPNETQRLFLGTHHSALGDSTKVSNA